MSFIAKIADSIGFSGVRDNASIVAPLTAIIEGLEKNAEKAISHSSLINNMITDAQIEAKKIAAAMEEKIGSLTNQAATHISIAEDAKRQAEKIRKLLA